MWNSPDREISNGFGAQSAETRSAREPIAKTPLFDSWDARVGFPTSYLNNPFLFHKIAPIKMSPVRIFKSR